MKLITAYIQPERLAEVKKSLYNSEIYKMTIHNVLGCGQQKGYQETYRGTMTEVNLLKKVCIKIVVNEKFVESCIDAIVAGAKTGEIGDGKIFVTNVEKVVRIRTSERDEEAIG